MGPPRHLDLLGPVSAETIAWPVPFADGIPRLMDLRGRRVVVLASGDPFWFGAGSVLVRDLPPGEWTAMPGRSTFSLAAARLGWPLEATHCLGLHAAPLTRLRPILAPAVRVLVLLRDGAAAGELAQWLVDQGFGETRLHLLESLGGPRERRRVTTAADFALDDVTHPVCAGLEIAGQGRVLPLAAGRGDDWFDHDGQITKRPVRALTLSALAPTPGAHLWDIGAGSGSIGIEWLLAGRDLTVSAIESDPARAARLTGNAARLGVGHRLTLIEGRAPEALSGLPVPAAVFVGGGLSQALLETLWLLIPRGARLVVNAVTLESEALLSLWHADRGGELYRIELAEASALGRKRGWKSAYPIVQWSVVR